MKTRNRAVVSVGRPYRLYPVAERKRFHSD